MNTRDDHLDDTGPGDDIRAGEYVLGVLDAGARRQVQARIAAEPAFAELVRTWDARFAPWLLRVAPVSVSDHVWPRIRTQLGWPSVGAPRPGLWNNVAFWRAATALAAAAGFAAIVIDLQPPKAPAPPVAEEQAAKPVTVLAHDDGSTGWIASVDPSHGKVLMVPVPAPADASGRVHELWIIPAGKAPLSLGFVSGEKAHTIAVPEALRRELAVGATLAITLEPSVGMPHAAPSGPVVAKGGIQQI
jgi:anti-sigma-K factor RskA